MDNEKKKLVMANLDRFEGQDLIKSIHTIKKRHKLTDTEFSAIFTEWINQE